MSGAYTDIDYAELTALRPSLRDRLAAGEIVVIRQAPEVERMRQTMFAAVEGEGGAHIRAEIEGWSRNRRVPSAEACAHLANALSEMRKAYHPASMFSDMIGRLGFPTPVVTENGAPRIQVPAAVESELIARKDILRSGVLEDPGNDPSYHVMLISKHAAHRDIGRPCYHFQANLWCALQDLTEEEGLLIFPEMFRDAAPDRVFFRTPDTQSPDPSQWGYGRAFRVPMRAGDILAFSGDQLHCNPVQRGDKLRLSWEFRVIGPCYDDVGWYRLGFFDLVNFVTRPGANGSSGADRAAAIWSRWKQPPESPLAYLAADDGRASAWQFLAWLVHHPDPGYRFLEETIEALKRFSFSEDRFLWPYFLAQRSFSETGLHERLLAYVVESLKSYFWASVWGGLALGAGRPRLADRAFAKSRALAAETHVDPSVSNIDYRRELAGAESPIGAFLYPMMPEDVDEVIRLYRSGKIRTGLNARSVVLIPGIPFPCHMFKPRHPFLQPAPFRPPLLDRIRRARPKVASHPPRSFNLSQAWPPF